MKYLSFLLLLTACGLGPGTERERTGNRGPVFNTAICGEITKPAYNGLATGDHFKVSDNSGTYYIQPMNEHVKNSLNNLNTFSDVCLYSQKEIGNGYEGNFIYAEQIKIRVDGSTL